MTLLSQNQEEIIEKLLVTTVNIFDKITGSIPIDPSKNYCYTNHLRLSPHLIEVLNMTL
jgi:hypothetical protein